MKHKGLFLASMLVVFLLASSISFAGINKANQVLTKFGFNANQKNMIVKPINLAKLANQDGQKGLQENNKRLSFQAEESGVPGDKIVVPVSLISRDLWAGSLLFLTNTDIDPLNVNLAFRGFNGIVYLSVNFVIPSKQMALLPLFNDCHNDCSIMHGKVNAPGQESGAGAEVRVYAQNDDHTMGNLVMVTNANEFEKYFFECVPEGRFFVYARKENFRDSQIHSVVSNGRNINLNLTLRPLNGEDNGAYSDDPTYDDDYQGDWGDYSSDCDPISFLGQIEITYDEVNGDTDSVCSDKLIGTMYQWIGAQLTTTPVSDLSCTQ